MLIIMQRRDFLAGMASAFSLGFSSRAIAQSTSARTKIAFGSCHDQRFPEHPIWDTIRAARPDAFVMLGDNIYADTDDMNHMAECYAQLNTHAPFNRLRQQMPVFATWDDHDFGRNDSGREYPFREESKKMMLDFFREPTLSERRFRPGVYTSYTLGRVPFDLQIILLDLRWFRSPIWENEKGQYEAMPGVKPELLGEDQWQWLEQELRKPAGARIIASSIQLISSEHKWERWAGFPTEKLKLESLLERLDIRNAVVISGDMHFGEISSQKLNNGFELFDFTSSGLNFVESSQGIINSKRLAVYDRAPNFGLIEVDWANGKISGEIRDYSGTARAALDLPLSLRSPVS